MDEGRAVENHADLVPPQQRQKIKVYAEKANRSAATRLVSGLFARHDMNHSGSIDFG